MKTPKEKAFSIYFDTLRILTNAPIPNKINHRRAIQISIVFAEELREILTSNFWQNRNEIEYWKQVIEELYEL